MRRKSLPGWLGATTPDEFIAAMHSDLPMPCHAAVDYSDPNWKDKLADVPQCSGQAIYLSNVCKIPRPMISGIPVALTLPKDHELVFSSPADFLKYHTQYAKTKGKTR